MSYLVYQGGYVCDVRSSHVCLQWKSVFMEWKGFWTKENSPQCRKL